MAREPGDRYMGKACPKCGFSIRVRVGKKSSNCATCANHGKMFVTSIGVGFAPLQKWLLAPIHRHDQS